MVNIGNFLELGDEEHFEVYKTAKEKGLDFVEDLVCERSTFFIKTFYCQII